MAQVTAKLPVRVTRVKKPVQVAVSEQVLKADRCLYKDVFLSVALTIYLLRIG
jgi:hypothetical protein